MRFYLSAFFRTFSTAGPAFCQFVVHNQEKKAEERARARYAGGRVSIHSHYFISLYYYYYYIFKLL